MNNKMYKFILFSVYLCKEKETMLKKLFILLFFTIIVKNLVFSQNLVPNPGFEEYNLIFHPVCNNDSFPVCKNWYSPTNGSPDYCNQISCFYEYNGVPQNVFGYQEAKEGNGYYHLFTYDTSHYNNAREYIQTRLSDSLKRGKKYCVNFYVSLVDSVWYATDVIGAYFSDTAVTHIDSTNKYYLLPEVPQVFNPHGKLISDKKNWTLISGSFIAKGGEQYITIGNFFNDNNTSVLFVGGSAWDGYAESGYYIDDVSVVECPPDTEVTTAMLFTIYPSPAQNEFTIKYKNLDVTSATLVLTDVCGRKVKEIKINNSAGKETVSIEGIASGIYLYRLIANEDVLCKGKMVVEK